MNGKIYKVAFPLFSNVAGGIFAIPGSLLSQTLQFRFYPVSFQSAYGSDDGELYDALKRSGFRSGYLNGTEAKHLMSADRYAEEIRGAG